MNHICSGSQNQDTGITCFHFSSCKPGISVHVPPETVVRMRSIFAPLLDEFDDLLDAHQSGEMNDKSYIAELNRLIGLEPDFIDLHAHQSFTFLEQDKPKKALDAALSGLAAGNRLIPESFSGAIEWGYVENRPYLRALQGAMLAYVRLRRHKDAATLIDKMLAYNPNDNQGSRYLLGSEVLRAGDKERAANIFDEYADDYPPVLSFIQSSIFIHSSEFSKISRTIIHLFG